jgi:hypothetical protein
MARSSPEETDCGPAGAVWVKAASVLFKTARSTDYVLRTIGLLELIICLAYGLARCSLLRLGSRELWAYAL